MTLLREAEAGNDTATWVVACDIRVSASLAVTPLLAQPSGLWLAVGPKRLAHVTPKGRIRVLDLLHEATVDAGNGKAAGAAGAVAAALVGEGAGVTLVVCFTVGRSLAFLPRRK